MKRAALIAYGVFSTLATFWFAYRVGQIESDHALLLTREQRNLEIDSRLFRMELLWGVEPCQGATVEFNP